MLVMFVLFRDPILNLRCEGKLELSQIPEIKRFQDLFNELRNTRTNLRKNLIVSSV